MYTSKLNIIFCLMTIVSGNLFDAILEENEQWDRINKHYTNFSIEPIKPRGISLNFGQEIKLRISGTNCEMMENKKSYICGKYDTGEVWFQPILWIPAPPIRYKCNNTTVTYYGTKLNCKENNI